MSVDWCATSNSSTKFLFFSRCCLPVFPKRSLFFCSILFSRFLLLFIYSWLWLEKQPNCINTQQHTHIYVRYHMWTHHFYYRHSLLGLICLMFCIVSVNDDQFTCMFQPCLLSHIILFMYWASMIVLLFLLLWYSLNFSINEWCLLTLFQFYTLDM